MKESLRKLNEEAKSRLLALLKAPVILNTAIPGFCLVRREEANGCDKCMGRPVLSLCINGRKRTTLAGTTYVYKSGQCLVSGVDMPGDFNAMDASAEEPFLGIALDLDAKVFTKLLSEHPSIAKANNLRHDREKFGAAVIDADEDLYCALLRLIDLAFDDKKREVLAPLVIEEIHYLLLCSEAAPVLSSCNTLGVKSNQMAQAIAYLKENIATNVFVDDMAAAVNMAPSTFYRHFKEVLGISPLQFHKQLRLYEAQRLMIVEGINVSSAAYKVGYESTSQFSRDYKRFFGLSPNKDVQVRLNQYRVAF